MIEKEEKHEIAFFKVAFNYFEGENDILNVPFSKLKECLDTLSKKGMYWDEHHQGFWTDLDKVKSIKTFPVKGVRYDDNPTAAAAVNDSKT